MSQRWAYSGMETGQPLPDLHAAWIGQILSGPIPRETKATCQDCAMCAGDKAEPGARFFNPATKCCTYQPSLPNFLVGRVLADSSPEFGAGRASVLERMTGRIAVTPLGLGQSPTFKRLYGQGLSAFGRAESLRCPHYLTPTGGCGIWRHRPGACATWFCKHVRGAVGSEFWRRLAHLFRVVEMDLAHWCVAEVGAGSAELATMIEDGYDWPGPAGPDDRTDDVRYQRFWGRWVGREREFFEDCAGLINAMDWHSVLAACGPSIRLLQDLVLDAYRSLTSDAVPQRLTLGGFQAVARSGGGYLVTSYTQFDPLVMPERLARVLPHFDGRCTDDALGLIRSVHGVGIDRALLRRLVDFGILTDSGDTPAGNAGGLPPGQLPGGVFEVV